MQNHLKAQKFPQFLRNWSESIRTVSYYFSKVLKNAIFLSTFNSNAEKMRKTTCFLAFLKNSSYRRPKKINGLILLFPFIPNNL